MKSYRIPNRIFVLKNLHEPTIFRPTYLLNFMFSISNFFKEKITEHIKRVTHNYLSTIFRVLLPTYDWNYSSLLYFWKLFRPRYPLFSIAVQPIVSILGALWPLLLASNHCTFPSISYYFHIPKIFYNFFPHTGKNRNRRKSNLLP